MDELDGLADAVVAGGGGMFEVAPQGLEFERETLLGEVDWMGEIAVRTGLPVSFAMVQGPVYPDVWRDVFARVDATNAAGGDAPPAGGGPALRHADRVGDIPPLQPRPTFAAPSPSVRRGEELVAELRKPEVKAAILAEADLDGRPDRAHGRHRCRAAEQMLTTSTRWGHPLTTSPPADRTVAASPRPTGVDPSPRPTT